MATSAWESFVEKDSPDRRYLAVYGDAKEIAMGAPTCGVIKIFEKKEGSIIIELLDASASFVWSTDSSSLAFPRWTRSKMQQLVLVRLPQGKIEPLKGEYSVLELESFADGLILGVDSPIHRPSNVSVPVKK